MRQLKHHEAKLLKKVDFLHYKHENNVREIQVLRRYHVQNREDYTKYNKLCGQVRQIANELALLDAADPFKHETSSQLIDKLYKMGLISSEKLAECEKVTVSAFCRRRLPIVMVRLKMAETVREAITFIEQGRAFPHFLFLCLSNECCCRRSRWR